MSCFSQARAQLLRASLVILVVSFTVQLSRAEDAPKAAEAKPAAATPAKPESKLPD
jgi:hypothetical protein